MKALRTSVLAVVVLLTPVLAVAQNMTRDADDENIYEESMRVVGGNPADNNAWPWQIAFFKRRVSDGVFTFFCGGSIIAPRWVLTAGHCFPGSKADPADILVVEQTNIISRNMPGGIVPPDHGRPLKMLLRDHSRRAQSGDE
jgi:secreted trypsin-like serine protease